ncbi:anachronism isoform X2 [Musca autumnalis]|uniref:anachronism isoform X2 n=1 Tax=Musca autumnalis TaxID=221902 RepID=UPI003CF072A3
MFVPKVIIIFGLYCLPLLYFNIFVETADDGAIHTAPVDGNNRKQILAMFNLTEDQMSRIYAGINAKKEEAEANGSVYFKNIKDFRINDIKNRISNAIQTKNSEEIIESPLHEMAAYPTCNSETTEASWLHDNNITIQFSSTLFEQKMQNLNLDSAILRLFKINPNETRDEQQIAAGGTNAGNGDDDDDDDTSKPKRCAEPILDAQIRVTVSIVQQTRRNKRERKKRICNTIMMNVSTTGWVEIDIRRAIYIWENVGKQIEQNQQSRPPVLVGYLMIEVHDEEEQPLKPGLFFKPPSCNQADLAIPWNYYRPYSPTSSFATLEVPRYPRLDVKLIGYASFAPINQPNTQPDTVYASLKDKLFNLTRKTSSSEADNESTTQIASAANNHLQEVDGDVNDEEEHLHRKRHLKAEELKASMEEEDVQLEQEDEEPESETIEEEQNEEGEADEIMPAETIEYNYRNHPRHRRHHRQQQQQQPQQHKRHHHQHQPAHHQRHNNNDDDGEEKEAITTNNNEYGNVHHRRHHFTTERTTSDPVEVTIEREQHETKLLQHIVHKLQQEQKQLLLLHQQQQQTSTYAI